MLDDATRPATADGFGPQEAASQTVQPLRALAGAGVALAGVVLGIAALLSVTSAPDDPFAVPPDSVRPLVAPPGADELDGAADAAQRVPAPPRAPAASPAPRPEPARAAEAPLRTLAVGPPAVTVLNNSRTTGLAARAAARFRGAGWPVRLTGNFRGRLRATTVYYEPGQQAAAQRFARTFRGVPRVLPRPAFLPGPPGLTVVLTRHFSA